MSAKGPVLTNAQGMTLYMFDQDKGGVSTCYDKCAELWPPHMAPIGMMAGGDYAMVTRKDGSSQLTYKGHPLYKWHKDMAPGDITGDGFRDVWHIAKP